MFIKTILVLAIIILIYVAYGAFYRNFGEKHFDLITRYFPQFMIWPKTQDVYVRLFKSGVLIFLFICIITIVIIIFKR